MRILIPVLVGSLIGYMTNWLAIKMLFKPHYEKKIFDISIPFTPGLIPKERKRMAENIGNAVGTHLLSTDTIIEAISNSENEEKIKIWINEKIENLRQEKMTIDEYLIEKIGKEYALSNDNIKKKSSDYVVNLIRNVKFKKSLKNLINENIERYNTEDLYNKLEIKANYIINNLRDSDNLRIEIEEFIYKGLNEALSNNRTLKEAIPHDIYTSIDKYLEQNKDKIGDNIRNILKDEDVKEKIQSQISNLIFDRSNKVLMAFISPDMISEKIFESIEKYIEKRETNEDIIEVIKFLVEKTKEKRISDLAKEISNIIDGVSMKIISNKVVDTVLNDDNKENIVEKILKLLIEKESSNKYNLKMYVWDEIEKIIDSTYTESKIINSVDNAVEKLSNMNVASLFIKVNDDIISNAYVFFKNIFTRFAQYELPRIIEMLNVSKIVEDKMNSFEIDYTEKLILDIAKKELNQITRLGALLGGILGLLSPLLQYIY